jgi:hypothetical protein
MTTALTGVIRDGRVELDAPARLPNGTRVRVEPDASQSEEYEQEPWPTTPEGIEAMLQELDAIEPAILTPKEQAEIAEFRAACRAKSVEKVRKQMGLSP